MNDDVVMRVILVALLILYHSFAPFSGNWDPIYSFDSPVYFWIGKFGYSFFLEAFVFISGLLAGYQFVAGGGNSKIYDGKFVLKKAKRLLLPSVVFSVIYFACFYKWEGSVAFIRSILDGCGHMWFLPMLFWCFVCLWLMSKINMHPYWLLAFAFFLTFAYNGLLPLRIGRAFYYFFFFLLGYFVHQGYMKKILDTRWAVIITLAAVFVVSYVACVAVRFHIVVSRLLRTLSAFCGLTACYLIVLRFIPKDGVALPRWMIVISRYSFGIYILQQFVLQAIYYNTSLPLVVDYILTPWIGVLLAFVLSFAGTHLMLKTRVGRFLVG